MTQAEIIAADAKAQNERLVERVQQAEQARDRLQRALRAVCGYWPSLGHDGPKMTFHEVALLVDDALRHDEVEQEQPDRVTEQRVAALTQALKDIKDNQGKVCENYELCDHAACRSSYASWAIADAALTGAQA